MNRATLLTAAGLLSAAMIGATGCEQDKTESARVGSARGETMHASGQPGTGAKHGTGTTASGVTTGNATTASPAATPRDATASSASVSAPNAKASASASASAKDAGSPGQTASTEGRGPGGIDQQKTVDAAASPAGASASASVNAPAAGAAETAVGAGPSGVNESPRADAAPAAAAPVQSPAAEAQPAAAADKADKQDEHADAWAEVKPSAAAAKDMQVTGTVKFARADHGVKVMVDLKGLTPNGKHGFHIHEKGDLSDPKLVSAGPHFNPEGKKHGGAEGDERHGGDLGNITADDKGHAKATIMAHGITIDDEKTGIVGRSVIVHAKPDDEKTDPSGNSGDRIAGGAIEKPAKAEKKSADAGAATPGEAQPAAAKTSEASVNESTTPDAAAPAQPQEELNK